MRYEPPSPWRQTLRTFDGQIVDVTTGMGTMKRGPWEPKPKSKGRIV